MGFLRFFSIKNPKGLQFCSNIAREEKKKALFVRKKQKNAFTITRESFKI